MPKKLHVIRKDGSVSVPYTSTAEAPMAIYVAAVTPYGEMTPYARIEKQLPKPEPKPEAAQEGGANTPAAQ